MPWTTPNPDFTCIAGIQSSVTYVSTFLWCPTRLSAWSLGPLLFLIYINDIGNPVTSSHHVMSVYPFFLCLPVARFLCVLPVTHTFSKLVLVFRSCSMVSLTHCCRWLSRRSTKFSMKFPTLTKGRFLFQVFTDIITSPSKKVGYCFW